MMLWMSELKLKSGQKFERHLGYICCGEPIPKYALHCDL